MNVRTYLNYGGNCAEALRFYETHLGGKIGMIMTYDQMPGQSDIATQMKGKVLHANLTIGGTELMASDVPPDRFQPMRSVYICMSVESDAEAERITRFSPTAAKSSCRCRKPSSQQNSANSAIKFGTSWMVIHEKPMGPPRP